MKEEQTILLHLHNVLHSSSFKERHRFSKNDFIRHRVLGFSTLFNSHLKMMASSLSVDLSRLFDSWKLSGTYSKQAFSKARKKLNWTAFTELNRIFLQQYIATFEPSLYLNKYRLLAVDGSLTQLPNSQALKDEFGTSKNQHGSGLAQGRASVLYDLLNEHVLDAQLAALSTGEPRLLETHLENFRQHFSCIDDPCIFLMDRNYPSFSLMHQLEQDKHSFVIRCTSTFCKEVREFAKDKSCDQKTLEIQLNSKRCKSWKGAPTTLKVRVVRIILPTGQEEYLLTNTDFDLEILSELYRLRWPVETFYGRLKGTMELENFSAKLPVGVRQDFYAKILLHNLSQMLIRPAQQQIDQEQEKKELKHKYKVNQNIAIGLLRDSLPKMLETGKITKTKLKQLVNKIKGEKTVVRPGRSPQRKDTSTNRQNYHITKRRAL